MKYLYKVFLLVFMILSLYALGCTASKKSNCGCPNKKGMVGY